MAVFMGDLGRMDWKSDGATTVAPFHRGAVRLDGYAVFIVCPEFAFDLP